MNLALDFGNTRIKWAVFDGRTEVGGGTFFDEPGEEIFRFLKAGQIGHVMYVSTRNTAEQWLKRWLPQLDVRCVDVSLEMPVTIGYKTPRTLGADRIAAVVGARILCDNAPLLVLDMGTCITIDYVDAHGLFKGGNISPGIAMRLRAMFTFTDRLPDIDVGVPGELAGRNTIEAMQNGAVRGAVLELEGWIDRFRQENADLRVVLTGGDGHYFEKFSNYQIFASPNLVLQGINELIRYNAK